MVRDPPCAWRDVSTARLPEDQLARGMPLLVTAELPPAILAWADALRRAHYPPERNRLRAHVTLLHGLPPSAEEEVKRLLARLAAEVAPPRAEVTGIMDLGRGTAFAVDSPAMVCLHQQLAEGLHGLIQQRDARPLRLHITIQNKVARSEAIALQRRLAVDFRQRSFRFRGFGLYRWDGRLWNFAQLIAFRHGERKAGGKSRHRAVDPARDPP